jgi:glutamate 5-kinase
MKRHFSHVKRLVVKIGSSLLTDEGKGLNHAVMGEWARQIAHLRGQGIEVILITSGAIAEGVVRLGLPKRPEALHELQASAAIGQMGLAQGWERALSQQGLKSAQILLTHDDLKARDRYLNARGTLLALLSFGVVPVVNENDTVVTDEIKLGDNDTLGALVANLIEAHLLILLTDQHGLYTADPRADRSARLIDQAIAGDLSLRDLAGGSGTKVGTGGMLTKVMAAERASRSGCATLIAHGNTREIIIRLIEGEVLGTLLTCATPRLTARKQWLASQLRASGKLWLDEGAVRALTTRRGSLLPVGVISVQGEFSRGALVSCVAPSGAEIARGLVNYPAEDIAKILRTDSDKIADRLGYRAEEELIHRDNLVILHS